MVAAAIKSKSASFINSVRSAIEKADVELKLHRYRVKNFRPNVQFEFARGHFLVKTARTGDDLEQCLKLRFDVFHTEYIKTKRSYGIDVDALDFDCDHLMVIDQRSGQVVGTYRLNSSLFTDSFYSELEFKMDEVLDLQGPHLELGRACIDTAHRSGMVIALLWRGIAEYIRQTGTRVLFGCSSIKTIDALEIALVTKHLRDEGFLTGKFNVTTTKKFKANQLAKMLEYLDEKPEIYRKIDVSHLIPPLFNSYLKMGAKLCGEPALDREFSCIDFLTVIPTSAFNSTIKNRYELSEDSAK